LNRIDESPVSFSYNPSGTGRRKHASDTGYGLGLGLGYLVAFPDPSTRTHKRVPNYMMDGLIHVQHYLFADH